jgi:hypothetical protein
MDSTILFTEANNTRKQASKLLNFTKIEDILKKYGSVNLIGSYVYNVMFKKDIDFHIVVKKLEQSIVKEFFEYLIDSNLYEEVIFHDKHKFNKIAALRYASKKALDSYYFGLRLRFENEDWQIGVNFITKPQQSTVEIAELFKECSEDQRLEILSFKKLLQIKGVNISSAYIYRAVLEKKIKSEKELFDYLNSLGYSV